MKKILLALSLALLAGTASAQWHGHGFRHHGHPGYYYGGSGGWVAPLIIGGVVGAAIANNRDTVVVQPQPTVVYQQPQSVIVQRQPVCTEWKEIQNTDGTIYRERTCSQ